MFCPRYNTPPHLASRNTRHLLKCIAWWLLPCCHIGLILSLACLALPQLATAKTLGSSSLTVILLMADSPKPWLWSWNHLVFHHTPHPQLPKASMRTIFSLLHPACHIIAVPFHSCPNWHHHLITSALASRLASRICPAVAHLSRYHWLEKSLPVYR